KAELSATQSCTRAFDERLRGDFIHSWRRTQSSGALGGVGARGASKRSSGSAIPYRARNPRLRWRGQPEEISIQIRLEKELRIKPSRNEGTVSLLFRSHT